MNFHFDIILYNRIFLVIKSPFERKVLNTGGGSGNSLVDIIGPTKSFLFAA